MTPTNIGPVDILIVGGGAREHALAWSLSRSPRCGRLFVAPGNDATPGQRVALNVDDVAGLSSFARAESIDLVVIGPEAALAAGVADELIAAGVAVFGPTRAAARLEWSKSYTRQIANELGLASPRFQSFDETNTVDEALAWWRALASPVVVKQAGLAGGKGVVVPLDDSTCETAIRSFFASGPIVLEERLRGPECSLLAFCDGKSALALPLAQDHKRLGVGDTGPNTGGMGAYAPAPIPFDAADLTIQFIQPVVDYMAKQGTPYVGMLYAGLMLTSAGPKLLEYNCRFGDPEAQVLLPLLDNDLIDLILACCTGQLHTQRLDIRPGVALGVVIAAARYPVAGPRLRRSAFLPTGRTPCCSGAIPQDVSTPRWDSAPRWLTPGVAPTNWSAPSPPQTPSTAAILVGARLVLRLPPTPAPAWTSTKAPVR